MKIDFVEADDGLDWERRYIIMARLRNFRGHTNVWAHIFRPGATESEVGECAGKNLVGPPAPNMPQALLDGASERAALECVLEAFTKEEANQLAEWLETHYAQQIESLDICPMNLPAPLGVAPLASIPESAKAGFINFDLAKSYDLPFRAKAYYDLAEME